MLDDVLLIIITHGPTQFIKVHSGVVLPPSPSPGQLSAVDDFEL